MNDRSRVRRAIERTSALRKNFAQANRLADLIVGVRQVPDGTSLVLLLDQPLARSNRDAIRAWALRYLDGVGPAADLSAHEAVRAFDQFVAARLESIRG